MTAPGDQTGDTLNGGNGNDRFHVRDGEADKITCGPGHDVVLADQWDVVITDATTTNATGSCEKVVRADVKTNDDSAENRVQSPSSDRKEK